MLCRVLCEVMADLLGCPYVLALLDVGTDPVYQVVVFSLTSVSVLSKNRVRVIRLLYTPDQTLDQVSANIAESRCLCLSEALLENKLCYAPQLCSAEIVLP